MKFIVNQKLARIEAKDGRKVVYSVAAQGLTLTALQGILDGADPETTTQESLQKAVEAALARKASVIPDHYRYQYGAEQSCGDKVAKTLTAAVTSPDGVDIEAARTIAKANDVEDRFDAWLVKGLNPGMVRMNLGNVLRGKARRGEPVTIGETTFNAE